MSKDHNENVEPCIEVEIGCDEETVASERSSEFFDEEERTGVHVGKPIINSKVEIGCDVATVASERSSEFFDEEETTGDYVGKPIINSKKNCCGFKVAGVGAVCVVLVALSCFAIVGIALPKLFLNHGNIYESNEIIPSNIGITDNSVIDNSVPSNVDNIDDNSANESAPKDPRDIEKIILRIASVLGSDAAWLVRSNNAESMALKWILETDEMGLTSESPNLIQRYLMVYFYYHTSSLGTKKWLSCGPKNTTINTSRWSICTYKKFVGPYLFTDEEDNQYNVRRSTRWLTPEKSECQWAGVDCDADADGNLVVTGLDLVGQGYGGSFPEQLAKVSTLETLHLDHNRLTGTLPKDMLSILPSLRRLYLNGNSFTGGIPSEWLFDKDNKILEYNNLEVLNIGEIVDSQMGNMLIKNFVKSMPNLISFGIPRTEHTGTIPKEVFELKQLRYIDLSGNPMNGNIPTEIGASKLHSVRFRDMELTGTLPSEIGNMKSLARFDVGSDDADRKGFLTGTIPVKIYNKCTALWRLDLSNNEFSGTIPAIIKNLSQLSKFDIRNNKFGGSIPSQMGSISSLKEMYVQGNVPGITGTLPNELCTLRRSEDGRQGGFATLEADCDVCPDDNDCCSKCCDTKTNLCYDKKPDRDGL